MDERRTGPLVGIRAARDAARRRNAVRWAAAEQAFRAEDDATLAAQLPAIAEAFGPEVAIRLAAERLGRRRSWRRSVAWLRGPARVLADEARAFVELATDLALHALMLFPAACAGILAALVLGVFLLVAG